MPMAAAAAHAACHSTAPVLELGTGCQKAARTAGRRAAPKTSDGGSSNLAVHLHAFLSGELRRCWDSIPVSLQGKPSE